MNKRLILALSGLLVISGSVQAQENPAATSNVITIETTTIRGNQELPTVLYLVPWQPPKINPLPASQTDDINDLMPEKIERNSFRRLLKYHQQLKSSLQ